MKLYSDECFPIPTVIDLRKIGYEITSAKDVNNHNRGMKDIAHLQYAYANGYVMITCDRNDYKHLHKK